MTKEKKDQDKKIIIDEDWKKEAQQEKEILAAQKGDEQKSAQEAYGPGGPLPKGDFAALVSVLATQALFAMGLIHVKGQEQAEPNLELARYNIDMLETLEEKTKGNLSDEEAKVLKNTLSDLRMGYVAMVNRSSGGSQ